MAAAPGVDAAVIETDALIVGAGPVGLFQVFELGLLEIKAHVVDSLPCVGGQCAELYADKPIYDVPGVPMCTGRGLIDSLMKQIEPMGARFHLAQVVTRVERQADQRFLVDTDKGTRFITRTLVIAGGVGSFQPRGLKLAGIEKFNAQQLFYGVDDALRFAGQRVVIVGGEDAAVDAAVQLAQPGPYRAASVLLLHRRDDLRAPAESLAGLRALCDAKQMQFIAGQAVGFDEADGRLAALQVAGADGAIHRLALDALVILLGLSPKLGPIADWGLALERKQLVVDTEKFETSEPGIFAVGDINTYAGKKKLILCGFHEATLAAFGAARHVFPDKPIQLQYTTTSPRLHALLGVLPPADD